MVEYIKEENEIRMNENKDLCLKLAMTDSEKGVIALLKDARYWDDPSAWKYYGNFENNFATIGNQQSKPDSALVEKIINSVDAVLMRECLKRGIDPESEDAPSDTRKALQEFFGVSQGILSNLTAHERTEIAKNIVLVVTGTKSNPSYSIIDKGEGQSPKKMPETFLSLNRSNKLRIPFVQGKFNMGATGALQFCGSHNLHLIISKRDPQIAKTEADDTNGFWGFTIIRRENPTRGMKSSTFKYLAPKGKILVFKAESLTLLPGEYPKAYLNPLKWGSFVKLYEYQMVGLKTLVTLDLYNRLSLLLPNIALPVRMCERRKGYGGHSPETNLSGLSVRLEEDKRNNLEPGFPSSDNIRLAGQEMNLLIYAFKEGKREKYSRREGVIFTVNGQAHAFLPDTFFTRKNVGLSYLKGSILVLIDCSKFEGRVREDLFMNSRDRLREGELKKEIEKELEEILKKHKGLRELKEKRRRKEIEGKIGDAKPLLNAIENTIKKSPTLSKLFIEGVKLTDPFDLRGVTTKEIYEGKRFPSFFKLVREYPKEKPKTCPINKRFRIQFETDAENEYFGRESCPGRYHLRANDEDVETRKLNLWNGSANLTVKLPEWVNIGNKIHYEFEVWDEGRVEPFYNEFYVEVIEPQNEIKGGKGNRKKPPSDEEGEDREKNTHLDLPNMWEVRKDEWEKYGFDKESALLVKYAGEETGYDFFINMENIHLLTEIKGRSDTDPKFLELQYKYGMVLIGLALLNEFEYNEDRIDEEKDVYEEISIITRAISPFLLPMISSLGELDNIEEV